MTELSSAWAEAQARRVPGVEARAGKFPGPSLIPALNAIQARRGWLPVEELEVLAREARRPRYEIEGLVSFYPHFRTEPPVKVSLHACHDLTCFLHDGEAGIQALREQYRNDPDVELIEVSCLGRCDTAPAVAVNERPASLAEVQERVEVARHSVGGHLEQSPAEGRDEPWPNDPYLAGSGVAERYASLRALLAGELDPEGVVTTLKESGLRGMGGAGFPTGQKWDLVRTAEPGGVKYVVCNADESEPGTFKDRVILATQPHLVLEGLLIAMVVVGAEEGWVFVRHEYGPEEQVLRAELEALREAGVVGPDACGLGLRLEVDVFVSPGGYILGEETALLECMEGHRGEPRNKPPFPGSYGLYGRPTLMNSVETLADVPVIVQRGAQWWADQGVGESVGWKFFAVSGHVERPDVYCVPMGTTVGELIDRAGGVSEGAALRAVQPGGASSNFIGPERLDLQLDFATAASAGTMLGSGAMVVMAQGTNLLAASTNVLRFFRDESCGKCVPCRMGCTKAYASLREAVDAGAEDVESPLRERILVLEETMRKTSICGLGQVALGPVVSVLGLDKGAAAARPQPRPGGAAGQPSR